MIFDFRSINFRHLILESGKKNEKGLMVGYLVKLEVVYI